VILPAQGQRRFFLTRWHFAPCSCGGPKPTPLLAMSTAGVCRGAAEASVQRLPLRGAGQCPQDHAVRSAEPYARVRPRIRRDSCRAHRACCRKRPQLSRESLRRGFERPRVIRPRRTAICSGRERGGSGFASTRNHRRRRPKSSCGIVTHLNRPYGIAFTRAAASAVALHRRHRRVCVFPTGRRSRGKGPAEHWSICQAAGGIGLGTLRSRSTARRCSSPWDRDRTSTILIPARRSAIAPTSLLSIRWLAPAIYASGIRNPSGIAVEPGTGKLWDDRERARWVGDNLCPITSPRYARAAFTAGLGGIWARTKIRVMRGNTGAERIK